ncbi:hypothetical protein BC629DRAFT_410356 [Irpex lacteus]|nr:hypothetical protein BC629DRAFT_410356 [Irpex lacteus]
MSGTISNEVDGDELCRLIISHLCVPETRFGIASSQGSSSFLEKTADGNDERKTRWRKEGATIQEIVRTTPNPYHSGSSTTKPPCKSNAESIWYRYWWSNKKIIRLESLDQPIEQPAALHDIIDLYWHAAEGFCQCICDEIWKKLPQNPQGRSVWTRDLNGMSCSEEQIKHYLIRGIGLPKLSHIIWRPCVVGKQGRHILIFHCTNHSG